MYRVLVTDGVSPEGLKALTEAPDVEVDFRPTLNEEELKEIIGEYDALIVRSATKVTAAVLEKARRLKIIGRAGVGVDNIDVKAATAKGIIVANAPGGNTVAAAEHTIGLMLSLARNIPEACARTKSGVWDRKSFMGVELRGKVLGIIGLGRIGSEVAKRAQAMEMKIIAYDPYIPEERARDLRVKLVPLDTLLQEADFITIHIPLSKETYHLIDREAFVKMKPGVRLINCARGGIVDEEALYEALKEGKVAGAALDVFEKEPVTSHPLFSLPNVVVTPHLGASTVEAQLAVAEVIAQEVLTALRGGFVRHAVNLPYLRPEVLPVVGPFLPLAEKLGLFAAQLVSGRINQVEVNYSGEIARYDTSLLNTAVLKGVLSVALQDTINYVNAPEVAKQRGIKVKETKQEREEEYVNLISVKVEAPEGEHTVAGTLVRGKEPRVVEIDGYRVDAVPEGYVLFIPHLDRPRIIGRIGTLIGAHDINIAAMQVGRKEIGGKAIMLLSVDSPVPEETLREIAKVENVLDVKMLYL
ncbi:D-3-phosphoglycerate dehydrogenase [Ammonifex degensii KC4]|uniref:D-3-phosphoglycerate dehydrogenase n=1 Tax=Ammonifex degensii (strain DSM 10501 / KC4) TaxID=429009 RepID=C9RA78_AMMDK|nr:phosphoglycerate dehydrogenase [Ammonifex degensii]ACX51187.1 D-3-phosphoglycerate dehydrogenase [Ammonifex degensii KC4]